MPRKSHTNIYVNIFIKRHVWKWSNFVVFVADWCVNAFDCHKQLLNANTYVLLNTHAHIHRYVYTYTNSYMYVCLQGPFDKDSLCLNGIIYNIWFQRCCCQISADHMCSFEHFIALKLTISEGIFILIKKKIHVCPICCVTVPVPISGFINATVVVD